MTRSAEKELSSLSKSLLSLIWQRIKALADQPRPTQARKLRAAEKAYRLRARSYRVIYSIDEEQKLVTITAIRHRRDIYR
ncbi:MAG: type II toxin-antitoxin system RelE/ParE family toxin [Dehalococcoidales bacterium]|nr:type II toxin-antitoxin system RelE/ParE family toxin [Dehalococcoidales bacterium]